MGGGKCADRTCKDLHLDKGIIPTDDDLVEYTSQLTEGKTGRPSTESIRDALRTAKEENRSLLLETDQGLSSLLLRVEQILKE
ncbi:uncharacterized protein L201_000620 [Kwoniella dendrophila CBS 6074]|uniref:Uncharacterized protein n=1 Tax=Kwoniella dendrophila CBS 6074 TaxID=1295534 RepID=A0AAX4JK23_9TREE